MTDREKVVKEALEWQKTPYIKGGRIKGCGCDCCTFIVEVLILAGIWDRDEIDKELLKIGVYSHDWFLHCTTEKYFRSIMMFASSVTEAKCYANTPVLPGSIVLTKAVSSKRWNHGGIAIKWPRVIHSVDPYVMIVDASRDPLWCHQELAIFDPYKYKNDR